MGRARSLPTPLEAMGPLFGSLVGIAIEATGEFVVVDAVFNAVLRVDARSGDRAIISR